MRFISRIVLGFVLSALAAGTAGQMENEKNLSAIISVVIFMAWSIFGWPKGKRKAEAKTETPNPNGANFVLDGVSDVLEVFDTKVAITSKRTASAILVRGLRGTKSIPYTSITAVQLRKADPINGYIQFSILGGAESNGGVIAAISDENTCFFLERNNTLAAQIRDYVETKILKQVPVVATTNIADQIAELAKLNKQGILSDVEFVTAKKQMLKL